MGNGVKLHQRPLCRFGGGLRFKHTAMIPHCALFCSRINARSRAHNGGHLSPLGTHSSGGILSVASASRSFCVSFLGPGKARLSGLVRMGLYGGGIYVRFRSRLQAFLLFSFFFLQLFYMYRLRLTWLSMGTG
ncbi:hypothetical protein K432DRAFT_206465 [Lepidopterella palustris CBS 459.81]|uniref:Transmembrane protein n=1 Tax=Lepidopterella palustris CBS 459.81 TaxID=1314670 RepID=A0A8E2DZ48_9PEZI|nr:hypothetical protein K432DRAFT_206465 [Lepidopterella palustris CBS 459.81]